MARLVPCRTAPPRIRHRCRGDGSPPCRIHTGRLHSTRRPSRTRAAPLGRLLTSRQPRRTDQQSSGRLLRCWVGCRRDRVRRSPVPANWPATSPRTLPPRPDASTRSDTVGGGSIRCVGGTWLGRSRRRAGLSRSARTGPAVPVWCGSPPCQEQRPSGAVCDIPAEEAGGGRRPVDHVDAAASGADPGPGPGPLHRERFMVKSPGQRGIWAKMVITQPMPACSSREGVTSISNPHARRYLRNTLRASRTSTSFLHSNASVNIAAASGSILLNAPSSKVTTATPSSHVRFPTVRQGRRPTMPLQHRHGYAAGIHRGLPVGDIN